MHHVQALGAVKVGWLASQQFELVLIQRLFEALAALACGRGVGDALYLDHFRVCAHFLGDEIASHFTAHAV